MQERSAWIVIVRKIILAANWKMNLTQSEAESYLDIFLTQIAEVNNVDVVLVPPFTAIPALGEALKASKKSQAVWLGAQNMHWEKCGAFTGEISAGRKVETMNNRKKETRAANVLWTQIAVKSSASNANLPPLRGVCRPPSWKEVHREKNILL